MRKLLLLTVLLAGCVGSENAVRELKYFKDRRTEACFASGGIMIWGEVHSAFTYVPCDKIPPNLLQVVQ